MKDFHEPKVWQKAHQLTLAVYQFTATVSREGLYGLTVSSEAKALEYHLLLAKDLKPIKPRDYEELPSARSS